jgi:hypothetical protein
LKTRRFGPLVLLAAVATLGVSGEVWAKPPPAAPANAEPTSDQLKEARKHYADGEKKYKAGDYAGAYAEFQAADNIKPAPQTARYMGLCQDALGHYRDAVAYFDRFLGEVPGRIAAEKDDAKKKKLQDEADEIKKREDEIKKMPGKIHVESVPPGAHVTVDGKPAPGLTPTDVDVAPGTHTVNVSADGRQPAEKQVDVAFASTQNVNAELEASTPVAPPPPPPTEAPPPQPAAPPPPPPAPRSMLPAYITGGVAIVAAGVGTVFGIMALNDKSNFDSNPTSQTADDGENHALIADMCFGVALTLGVTSAVLFLTPDEGSAAAPAAASVHPRPRHRVTIIPTPIITPNGGGGGALVRF